MKLETNEEDKEQAPSPRLWLGLIITYLSIAFALLICGGDLGWWQGWIVSVLIVATGMGSRIWAEKRHPGLVKERVTSEMALVDESAATHSPDVKPWDKVLAPLMGLSISYPVVIVAGLDHRFGWTPAFSIWLNILGLVPITMGYAFASWALIENRNFSSMVRIQVDRGHEVCESGPYRFVRHPGYAGNILALAGIVLALNSMWTLLPAGIALIIAIIRTGLEDRTLQAELPGYQDYARRVRYRLLPGIY